MIVKTYIDLVYGVAGVSDSKGTGIWSRETVMAYTNLLIKEIAAKIKYAVKTSTVDAVADQIPYSFPTDYIDMVYKGAYYIYDTGLKRSMLVESQSDEHDGRDEFKNSMSIPRRLVKTSALVFHVNPPPTNSAAAGVNVFELQHYYYPADLSASAPNAELVFPKGHEFVLIYKTVGAMLITSKDPNVAGSGNTFMALGNAKLLELEKLTRGQRTGDSNSGGNWIAKPNGHDTVQECINKSGPAT